jgi:hypothetical protein
MLLTGTQCKRGADAAGPPLRLAMAQYLEVTKGNAEPIGWTTTADNSLADGT